MKKRRIFAGLLAVSLLLSLTMCDTAFAGTAARPCTNCSDQEMGYDNIPDPDFETNHIPVCNNCKCECEHVPCVGGTATCTSGALCVSCGREYGMPLGHDFEGAPYISDGTAHWQVCQRAGCNASSAKTACSGGTATCSSGAICDACKHEYGAINPNNHDCTAANGRAATCIMRAICGLCGEFYGGRDPNHHDSTFSGSRAATCRQKAFCGRCGLEYGELLEHDFDIELYENDGTEHWKVCKRPGCGALSETGACSGGTATCVERAVCGICNKQYGGFDMNNHDYAPYVSDGTAHWQVCKRDGCGALSEKTACSGGTATCTAKAVCEVCENEYGEPLGHDFEDAPYHSDGTAHWQECNREGCGEETVKTACAGGTATCTAKAVCAVCGFEYGDILGHDFENAPYHSDGTAHWQECNREGCGALSVKTACSGGTAACTTKAVCAVCGFEYGDILGHDESNPPATCYAAKLCAREGCGAVLQAKLLHWYGDFTCNGDGTHTAACLRGCGKKLTVPCEEAGDALSVCPVCGNGTYDIIRKARVTGAKGNGEWAVRGVQAPDETALYAYTITYEIAGKSIPFTGTATVSLPLDIAEEFMLVRVDTLEEIPFTYKNGVLTFKISAAGMFLIVPKT